VFRARLDLPDGLERPSRLVPTLSSQSKSPSPWPGWRTHHDETESGVNETTRAGVCRPKWPGSGRVDELRRACENSSAI
jgi:hypothetical protein